MPNQVFDIIRQDLEQMEDMLLTAVSSSNGLVAEVGEHLVTSGGKRLRPALCLLAARGGTAFALPRALPLATALELIHTASLVHDDVIDEAGTRRGVPTANAKWGNKISILGGDYIFARGFQIVADADYPNYVSRRLADLVCNLSIGEILQDRQMYRPCADVADYYGRISKKTAEFLEICCELGSSVGGMGQQDVQAMARYGHSIGMAFQIKDDLLDIQESSEQIGKPAGNDIRQGIVTLPVLRALETSPHAGELRGIVTDPSMTDGMLSRALSIVRESDGVQYAQEQAGRYLAEAKAGLPACLPEEIRETFVMAADFIGERNF